MHADYCNPLYYQSFTEDVLALLQRTSLPGAKSIEWNEGVYLVKDSQDKILMMGALHRGCVCPELVGRFDDQLPYLFGEEDEGGDLDHFDSVDHPS